MGMDLAEAWWQLVGCELYGAGKAPKLEFGQPVRGLALGFWSASSEWPTGQDALGGYVVLKNMSGKPLRVNMHCLHGRLSPAFGVRLEVTSPGRQVRGAPEGSGMFSVPRLELPPGGIAAAQGTITDSEFEPRLQPGDSFTVTLEYETEDTNDGVWAGKLTSNPVTVRVVAPTDPKYPRPRGPAADP
jgi:hypothetical protein